MGPVAQASLARVDLLAPGLPLPINVRADAVDWRRKVAGHWLAFRDARSAATETSLGQLSRQFRACSDSAKRVRFPAARGMAAAARWR